MRNPKLNDSLITAIVIMLIAGLVSLVFLIPVLLKLIVGGILCGISLLILLYVIHGIRIGIYKMRNR